MSADIRNPKPETRTKAEVRGPNLPAAAASQPFGVRCSALVRVSGFGIRAFLHRCPVVITSLLISLPIASPAAAVPQPVPGWRMELVAEAPQVNHPSVVCTAPDGRVFVAEDPMDIRIAADATEGRILCLRPDGRWTVFAEGLHAVFGMQYLEGRLYVLQNPKFSVFDDRDGVGTNRRELIEQTNPKPWALDWNDHVPANFKLAMDGYFYMAVGDKGLYGARGTDGREVNLHGGGVVRIRPDGTGLEVHSTGVRNILDVAINAEDEIFTYDNTDEHDWMGRVTHMVEGGFYGYPHDFIPRRPYTLWMMHDLGGGAACGTLAYNEDALPVEYHGNLFLSDFGQRQVNRLIIERAGATYRVVKHEKLFPNPPADFRPVGIAWSADGLSMFICDWQHRDEKGDVRVGRLWKLTWEGKSHATPKPDWYVAAATGKNFIASDDTLLSAMSHPSREVRLTAQRRLADRVKSIADGGERAQQLAALGSLLTSSTVSDVFKMHVLWALDGIDEGLSERYQIINLAANPGSTAVRVQALRHLGLRRVTRAVPSLQYGPPGGESPIVRVAAAIALGRIPATQNVTALLRLLKDADPVVRFAAFTAMNRIGRQMPEAWPHILRGLFSESGLAREGARFALRETYDLELVKLLAMLNSSSEPAAQASTIRGLSQDSPSFAQVRTVVLELLAAIAHKAPEWKGEWWAYHPALQPPPERTITWEGTELILATLRSELGNADVTVRRVALKGLLAAKDASAAPQLRARFSAEADPENRRLMLQTLAVLKDDQTRPLVVALLKDATAPESLRLAAIEAAGQLGGDEASSAVLGLLGTDSLSPALLLATIENVALLKPAYGAAALRPYAVSTNTIVREAALDALIKVSPDQALEAIRPLLQHADFAIRESGVKALGRVRDPQATTLLLTAFDQPVTRDAAVQALTRRPDVRAVPAYLAGLDASDVQLREACRSALQSIRREAWPEVEPRLKAVGSTGLSLLKKIYGGEAAAREFFSNVPDILEPGEYLAYAVRQNGDADEGRRLFNDVAGMACISCHRVGGEGVSIGPDLTSVGSQFSRHELAESILYPSKAVREGYQAVEIETKDDESFSGLAKGETGTEVLLLDRTGNLQRIPKDKVANRRNSEFSLMPEGLHAALTLEQFAGLISYLESLKGAPVSP